MNTRRKLIVALGAGALAAPFAIFAQQPPKVPRIAVITSRYRDAFVQGLREHGWIEGKNIHVEYRISDSDPARAAEVARELSSLKIECLVASGNLSIGTLKRGAPGIPLVMAFAADVVGSGFVENLRRPGGRITGLTNVNEALTGKRLELLRELNPKTARVAMLKDSGIAAHHTIWKEAQTSAQPLGIKVLAIEYRGVEGINSAFAAIAREKADALLVPQSPVASDNRALIMGLAAKGKLPAIYQDLSWVESGGLASYGSDEADMWRRAAGYVDKILKGANPAELPVEQPTKFELAINMKTAKALGIKVPQSILVRTTRVIE
jgi:putative ABC transport system substrate-binding protein